MTFSLRQKAFFLLGSLRPKQWAKNLFVLAPVIFTEHALSWPHWLRGVFGFGLFSLASSSVYLLNDIVDRKRDAVHPFKKNRPVASGELSVATASGAALFFSLLALALSFCYDPLFFFFLLSYLLAGAAYSILLRHLFLFDVMAIALLYVLRVLGGIALMHEPVSPWILITTFFLAMLLAFLKRSRESKLVAKETFRPVLREYTPQFLNSVTHIFVGLTIVTYALYTFLSAKAQSRPYLMLTTPLVVYGVLRFFYLMTEGEPRELEDVLFQDPPLLATVFLWAVSCALLLLL